MTTPTSETGAQNAASLLARYEPMLRPGCFPGRAWLLRPQEEGVPADLAALLPPGILRALKRARIAAVSVNDEVALPPELVARATLATLSKEQRAALDRLRDASGRILAAELGPMGLRGHGGYVPGHPQAGKIEIKDAGHVMKVLVGRSGRNVHPARDAARRLLAVLGRDAMSALRRARVLCGTCYNWLAVDPDRRIPALLSYPALGTTVVWESADTIVFGGSLEDLLEEGGVRRPLARHLANRPLAPLLRARRQLARPSEDYVTSNGVVVYFNEGGDPVRGALRCDWMRLVPPHALPERPDDWAALMNLVCTLKATDRSRFWADRAEVEALLADTLATDGWRRDFHPSNCPDLGLRLKDARDCVRHLLTDVVLPTGLGLGVPYRTLTARDEGPVLGAVARALAGRGGLRRLLAVSAEWHARTARGSMPMLGEKSVMDGFDLPHVVRVPVEGLRLPNGMTARAEPILTAGELRAEGREMGHCIGSYVGDAALGKIVAFRVHVDRPGADPVRITATLRCAREEKAGSAEWSEHDMRLARNAGPSSRIGEDGGRSLRAQMLDLVRRLAPEGPSGGQEAACAARMAGGLHALRNEPEVLRGHVGATLRFWAPMLPKRLRTGDAAAFVRLVAPDEFAFYEAAAAEAAAADRGRAAREVADEVERAFEDQLVAEFVDDLLGGE